MSFIRTEIELEEVEQDFEEANEKPNNISIVKITLLKK